MNDTNNLAVVEFLDGAPQGLQQLTEEHPDDVTVLHAAGFNANDPGTVEAVIVLTPLILRAITAIVREHIAAKKHVRVKVEGIELTGVSGKDAVKILEELADSSTA